MKRKAIPLKVKLAAALLQNPFSIPYEDSKQMTADQIISCFHLDHYPILHVDGGPDEPWNLQWRFIGEHREKTKADVKALAKSKRIRRKSLTVKMLEDMTDEEFAAAFERLPKRSSKRPATQKRKILSRPFPKRPTKARTT